MLGLRQIAKSLALTVPPIRRLHDGLLAANAENARLQVAVKKVQDEEERFRKSLHQVQNELCGLRNENALLRGRPESAGPQPVKTDAVQARNESHLAPFGIHFINLDRSPDRLALFRRTNAHLKHVVRVAAIDGKAVDRDELVAKGIFAREVADTYADGAIGCALSHISRWRYAVEAGRPLTVAEDDAIIHRSFETSASKILSDLPPDWDVMVWGWNFDAHVKFDLLPGISGCTGEFFQEDLRRGWHNFQDLELRPQPFRLFANYGTICYTVSPKGAAAFLERAIPIRNEAPGIINWGMDMSLNPLYPSLSAFVCFPPLVITLNDTSISTIQNDWPPESRIEA
jgi:GR25 family glycosyltransferase involved in LPS biosynthesis